MSASSEVQPVPPDLASTGERIERLLEASDAGGPVARERSEELVRLVADLYGAGMERMLDVLHEAGALTDDALDALAADQLVSGLLLVHGLHPYSLEDRVGRALDGVRPYLGSHGGDVEVVDITDEGVVRLRMLGSCDGCASSAMTLQLAVEGAVTAAAPEVTGVEVAAEPRPVGATTIPLEALTTRIREGLTESSVVWIPLDDDLDATPGRAIGWTVTGLDLVLVWVSGDGYAYRAGCPSCGGSLAGAPVERGLGYGAATAVLTCPRCRQHYDVRNAGRGVDNADLQLTPVPLLQREGRYQVAVAAVTASADVLT